MNYNHNSLIDNIEYSGDLHDNLKKALAFVDPGDDNLISNWEITDYFNSQGATRCSCSHEITYEYRIRHKETSETLSIGSQCIKKFSNDMFRRANRIRRIADPNNHYCQASGCEGPKVQQSIIDQFPDKTAYYHKKCLHQEFSKCGCGSYIGYDCTCDFIECKDCTAKIRNPEPWRTRCYPCYLKASEERKRKKLEDRETKVQTQMRVKKELYQKRQKEHLDREPRMSNGLPHDERRYQREKKLWEAARP
jgi:hypothetical protein